MTKDIAARLRIAALIYGMTNAVLFGAGIVTVLTVPAFREHAGAGIVIVVAASLILAAPIAWFLAPRLRARYWRTQRKDRRIEPARA